MFCCMQTKQAKQLALAREFSNGAQVRPRKMGVSRLGPQGVGMATSGF